jgi:hypothetical protein
MGDDHEQAGHGSPDPRSEKDGLGLEHEDRGREGSPGGDPEDAPGEARGVPDPPDSPLDFPSQSPLFHAQHAARYDRQQLMGTYETRFNCRLIVMIDAIFPYGVTFFEELLNGADHE